MGSGGSPRSAGEFLTLDSARDALAILALGALAWTPECGKTVFHDFLLQPSKNLRKIKVFGPWGPGPRAQGCASRARNPKGPQITPFCHQLGRHPTILHILSTRMRRISARISPDRSNPLNLNFCLTIVGPSMPNIAILLRTKNATASNAASPGNQSWKKHPLGPWGNWEPQKIFN